MGATMNKLFQTCAYRRIPLTKGFGTASVRSDYEDMFGFDKH
jgi:hypothetical protein